MQLYFVLTGTHLSPFHGSTEEEVEKDKLPIYDKIETQLASDSKTGMAKSTAMGILGLSECFKKVNPDILVCLGDRYEVFAGVYAAAIMQIPVAHIHGGELTFGSIDDSIRHSITLIFELDKSFKNGFRKFIKKAIPLTLITSFAFIVAIYLLNNFYELNEAIYKVIFIGLASLTFPHILLEYLLEKNEKRS